MCVYRETFVWAQILNRLEKIAATSVALTLMVGAIKLVNDTYL